MAHQDPPYVLAPPAAEAPAFQPYVPASARIPEFTAKAILLGALFGLIFGASTVYLGLRAGRIALAVNSGIRADAGT